MNQRLESRGQAELPQALRGRCRRVATVFAVWLCLALVGYVRYLPPAPQSSDADSRTFSADRALVLLKELIGDGIPHPVGSLQNQVVRDRIVARLRESGYVPAIQIAEFGDGTVVENVVARLDSPASDSAIVLVAHYDSVEEGPGASDDGVGVAAILEVARMLRDRVPSRNDVVFLFTDGEEYGALGAEAFVNEHPWARDIAVVLCFDARGTAGPSLMFETSDANAWLIEVLAGSLSRPVTSSLFDDVYEYLPTYTDLTPFLNRGHAGYNFAFIRGVDRYHTSEDNYDSVTPGSLQHHGQNAWQLTSALIDVNLSETTSGNAVYTDLFAGIVLWWNEGTGRVWATTMPVLMVALLWWQRRRGLFRWRELVWAGLLLPLILGLSIVPAWFTETVFRRAGWLEPAWSPWAVVVILGYWLAATIVFAPLGIAALRWASVWAVWATVWTGWSIAAGATAWLVAGASYLFLLPVTATFAVGVTATASTTRWRSAAAGSVASYAGVVAAGCLWLPQQFLFYDALGLEFGMLYVLCSVVLLATAGPLLAGRRPTEEAVANEVAA